MEIIIIIWDYMSIAFTGMQASFVSEILLF